VYASTRTWWLSGECVESTAPVGQVSANLRCNQQGLHVKEHVLILHSLSTPSFTGETESKDSIFDDYASWLASLETVAEKLVKDTKAYDETVT
jgi:hypothetical protein